MDSNQRQSHSPLTRVLQQKRLLKQARHRPILLQPGRWPALKPNRLRDRRAMTQTQHNQITGIHKLPLYGALGIVVLALVLVSLSVAMGKQTVGRTVGEATLERSIRFQTEPAGAFSVLDARTNEKIHSFGSGEGAFIRISIRSMTLNRTLQKVRYDLPYQLVQTADGKLSLIDTETGHFIKLNAFGSVATDGFAKLLSNQSQAGA